MKATVRQQADCPDASTRRQLLRTAVVVATGWRVGVREAIAQARVTGKPMLSADTMTRALSTRAALESFKAGPKAFVREHFSLTRSQERFVELGTPQEVGAIRKAVNTALRNNAQIVCSGSQRTGPRQIPGSTPVSQAGRFEFASEAQVQGSPLTIVMVVSDFGT